MNFIGKKDLKHYLYGLGSDLIILDLMSREINLHSFEKN